MTPDPMLVRAVVEAARPMQGSGADFDAILARTAEARVVLIGDASHGTHDFHRVRSALTKRLIVEQGFHAVALEADAPDADRVNRYVRGLGSDGSAIEALAGFRRFPSWMWRNADVLDFVGWLRAYDDGVRDPRAKVGFYGLDRYGLHASVEAVLACLDQTDPRAAAHARQLYACFDHFSQDPRSTPCAGGMGLSEGCERELVGVLMGLQRARLEAIAGEDEHAPASESAEQYYRAMFRGRIASWNLRDRHMFDTLIALARHRKVVVWAHNSHVGDARATDLSVAGELNLGQLARERQRGETLLIGLCTYSGTVTAASSWDGPSERKTVRPAVPHSYEELFHHTRVPCFVLMLSAVGELRDPLLQRAIGVVYRPESERASHYYHVSLAAQFDAVVYLDETRALEPLGP